MELSFQDLFQSNHFKRPLSLNKQMRLKADFCKRERGRAEEESLFLFKAKLIHQWGLDPT